MRASPSLIVRPPPHEPSGAAVSSRLLVRRREEQDVAIQTSVATRQLGHRKEVHDRDALRVERAPADDVAGGDESGERIDDPAIAICRNDIEVRKQHDRSPGSASGKPGPGRRPPDVGAGRRRLDQLRLEPFAFRDIDEQASERRLVSRRVRRIDLDREREQFGRRAREVLANLRNVGTTSAERPQRRCGARTTEGEKTRKCDASDQPADHGERQVAVTPGR
jgi:hypothetical protein